MGAGEVEAELSGSSAMHAHHVHGSFAVMTAVFQAVEEAVAAIKKVSNLQGSRAIAVSPATATEPAAARITKAHRTVCPQCAHVGRVPMLVERTPALADARPLANIRRRRVSWK